MIVIGDVHGEYDLLQDLLGKLPQTDNICFVGDLIDRGPKIREVVDLVIQRGWKTVLGNHEDFFNYCVIDDELGKRFQSEVLKMWTSKGNGGQYTIDQFGDDIWYYIPWFNSLPLFIEYKQFLISHSYAIDGKNTDREELLWTRGVCRDAPPGVRNIFGHDPELTPQVYYNKHWNIDTGAYLYGMLTALDLDTMTLYSANKK